jgi:hypothetical protein
MFATRQRRCYSALARTTPKTLVERSRVRILLWAKIRLATLHCERCNVKGVPLPVQTLLVVGQSPLSLALSSLAHLSALARQCAAKSTRPVAPTVHLFLPESSLARAVCESPKLQPTAILEYVLILAVCFSQKFDDRAVLASFAML